MYEPEFLSILARSYEKIKKKNMAQIHLCSIILWLQRIRLFNFFILRMYKHKTLNVISLS